MALSMALAHMQGTRNDNVRFGKKSVLFQKAQFTAAYNMNIKQDHYTALSWDILHYSVMRYLAAKSQMVN